MSKILTDIVDRNELHLDEIFLSLWRNKFQIMLVTAFLLGALILLDSSYKKPVYSARTTFGFQDEQTSKFDFADLGAFIDLTGVDRRRDENDIITQIEGKDFLRKVVEDLNLIQDPEFFPRSKPEKADTISELKTQLKEFLNLNLNTKNLSYEQKLDFTATNLSEKHFVLNELETGGYEIKIKSENPIKAALIANTITEKFLAMRLKDKILQSDQSLEYLEEKISEVQEEMDHANTAVEIYALENNVISDKEFQEQYLM